MPATLPIRNVAIIAHVDHGKTTLVDALLRQSGTFLLNETVPERVMDSLDLERERGITIAAKNCCLTWEGYVINIVDTPGHADFGGEVERILSMVDGALLLVDAAEGPLPQTRFVVKKALEARLPLVLIINKIDRRDARTEEVEEELLNLLLECGAEAEYLSSPVIYTNARAGAATKTMKKEPVDMRPVFEAIRDYIPSPKVELEKPLSMIVANLGYSDYVGRLAIGRMKSGTVSVNDQVLIAGENKQYKGRVMRIYGYEGLKMVELPIARAGQIVALAGFETITIGDTATSPDDPLIQPRIHVEEPTVSVIFSANTSPFAGREGKYVTGSKLKERLFKEGCWNVSLRIEEGQSPDQFVVAGRGELQLAILIETMRREGYEMEVSKPKVIEKTIDGAVCEPFENLVVDIPEEYIGVTREFMALRRGTLVSMSGFETGMIRLEFHIPSRGLIGIRSTFLTITRGLGIMHSIFEGYRPLSGPIPARVNGALVASVGGAATGYAIAGLAQRGKLFVFPGTEVYSGMIVGEHAREHDLDVNITKQKKLTNMRSSTCDETVVLTPPLIHSLETAIEWINDNESMEITPKSIRLRRLYPLYQPKHHKEL
ncbi:MAG: translational GTPase TypA [Candidatus Eremiobacteraeota bacterium]|nr:translational GTPase TypA [Candidatus Eremiobacteraeota bacterium]